MDLTRLCIFAATVVLVAGQGTCRNGRVEREELTEDEDLETMWDVRPPLDCSTEKIDAATMTPDKKTYFFKGEYYWRLIGSHVAPGYPRLIRQDWDGLPGHLDAALTWKDGRTFFFKGRQYWSFHNKAMDFDYPRNISEGFCGLPNNLEAAVLWKSNNLAYFFKGKNYWRFDGGESCVAVKEDYPYSIKEQWENMPADIDAALQWENGRTYLIKNGFYYRYKDDDQFDDGSRTHIPLHQNWGLKCEELRCRIPPKSESPLENETSLFK